MKLRVPALAVLAVVVIVLAACTPADHRDEARDLQEDLRELAGVADVTLRYDEPELLDAADVNLKVVMTADASPDDVAAVFEATYAGLTEAHEDEEGNLTVRVGDDELGLRTFESEADASDVGDAALAGATVAGQYPRVHVHVMTQEVEADPHVESLALVRLPKETRPREADRVRAAIADEYGDLAVRVDVRVRQR